MRPDLARALLLLAGGNGMAAFGTTAAIEALGEPVAVDDQAQAEAIIFVFDGLHRRGGFELSDRLLAAANVGEVGPATVVAALTVTWHAREHLPSRPAFVERCEARLVELVGAERAERLMRNRR